LRVISSRYWRTNNGLNVSAVADCVFAASNGDGSDPHAPGTVIEYRAAPGLCDIRPKIGSGYRIFVTIGDLARWKRCTELAIDGLEWTRDELQGHYDRLTPEVQAAMTDEALYGAAEGSGVTVRQVRALRRDRRPARGRKPKG
jgi:hypothetical protein